MESARQAHEAFRAALDAEGADATAVGQAALAMKGPRRRCARPMTPHPKR
jgi:hypothetical protein